MSKESMRGIYKAAYKAAGIAFDEAAFLRAIKDEDAKDEGENIASRIMAAIRAAGDFSDDEVSMIEQALTNAGLADVANPSELASDAAIMKRRERLYAAGKIGYDHLRSPIVRPMSDEARADMLKRFPDMERLKG